MRWLVCIAKLIVRLLIVVHRSVKLVHLRLTGIRVVAWDLISPLQIRIFLRFEELVDEVDFIPELILVIVLVYSHLRLEDFVNSEFDGLNFSRCARGHHNIRIVVQDKLKLVAV